MCVHRRLRTGSRARPPAQTHGKPAFRLEPALAAVVDRLLACSHLLPLFQQLLHFELRVGPLGFGASAYVFADQRICQELAERAGLSTRSICDFERGGTHTPRRATVDLLAAALALSPSARRSRGRFAAAVARQVDGFVCSSEAMLDEQAPLGGGRRFGQRTSARCGACGKCCSTAVRSATMRRLTAAFGQELPAVVAPG
jgi:transcriptional regulator with XRE-family HTH domain